jgi:DNA-binding CsgD family transcriptional regulator/predicted ATPase
MADRRFALPASAPLMGRHGERAALAGMLAHVRGGHSSVLVLRGEAGIGKTALLRYLNDAASGFTVTRCAGVESEMELPFAQLHEVCTPLLGGIDTLPEPQRHALSVALGVEAGQSPDKLLVALATLGLLSAVSGQAPVLCIVEDAHWLDQASAQVLGFVGRRLHAEPVGLVFAARTPVTAPDHLIGLPELQVEGLDEQSAHALLDSVTTTLVDKRVRARIVDETQGNPLALLELGERIGQADFAGGFATVDGVSLSHRIEAEYLARLSALPPDTQQWLLLAAADPVGDTTLIRRAAKELDLGVDAAAVAVDSGLLTIGASVRFRHPLLRSAVYRAADIEHRRAAHGALAVGTDPNVDPDRRAWHRAYAAPGHDEEVAAELIGSADRAQGRGGAAAAAAFWERAVAVTPDAADRTSRALIAAQAKYEAGDFDATHLLLAEAATGPMTDLEQARADLLQAQVAAVYRGGDGPPLLLQAAIRLQPIDIDLARRTYLQALIAASYAGRLGDPDVRSRIARAAQALPLDPPPTPSTQLLVHGFATWMADGFTAAAPTLKDAVRQYRNELPDPGFVGFGFNVMAMHLCDDDAWYALCTGQVESARRSGMLSALPFALDSLTEFYVQAGELAKAEAAQMEADRIHPTVTAARSPRTGLLSAAWRGDASAMQGSIRALTEASVARGEGWRLAFVEYSKAVLYNGLGDYALAADAAETAGADAAFVAGFPWRALYELVEAAVRSDQLERAHLAAEQLSEFATASGSDAACAMAARSRALLAPSQCAEELYREAIERFGRTRMAVHHARARLAYGEWLRRQNRRIDARMQLKPAYEALAGMGAHGFAQRARRELQATGEKVRRRNRSTSVTLTPQEEQIAQLARERRTNAEIGAQLFLSARTVEWHLGKILAKLEIKSRRELDTALRRRSNPVQD